MALKINVRKESEVPQPTAAGRVNEDLEALKAKMGTLPAGMVLEVEVDKGRSVRSTKFLITRAAKQVGSNWKHWHLGNKVFAEPAVRRRGRRRRRAPR